MLAWTITALWRNYTIPRRSADPATDYSDPEESRVSAVVGFYGERGSEARVVGGHAGGDHHGGKGIELMKVRRILQPGHLKNVSEKIEDKLF